MAVPKRGQTTTPERRPLAPHTGGTKSEAVANSTSGFGLDDRGADQGFYCGKTLTDHVLAEFHTSQALADRQPAPTDVEAVCQIAPPQGMTATAYFDVIVAADNSYCDCIDYELFPGLGDSYNSNSYVIGILSSTGGTARLNFTELYGGTRSVSTEELRP